ncbi:hypothetical protein DXG01_000142 [Tephrocybe rancida]|nr:hypothetical protein DXG01_000142 [Tephrocybe rancida]
MSSLPDSYGNFDLVKRVKLDFTDVTVSKWRSRKTGLSVVHLDYEGKPTKLASMGQIHLTLFQPPSSKDTLSSLQRVGYILRTLNNCSMFLQVFNDSGCPHTLEHLVFMGSEKYPYKGVLDNLANRGFSNGTNAWTDTDHTAYTISTAGGQGFLQLLPVYVDHILYPTITKAGIQRLVNHPKSAYRSETGGLMEALRVLTPKQIRDYHGTYYVPHNLSLIVAGKLSSGTLSLLDVVQKEVEPSIIAHDQANGPRPSGWKRPFVETPSAIRPPIEETIKKTVEFPEKDESMGEIILSFLGPPPNAFLERRAIEILGNYLSSSAVAPLNKEYVEIEQPLCGYIYFTEDTCATSVDLPIYIGSVPTEHLETFDVNLRKSFQRIVEEGIDMKRMAMILNREERQLRSKLESAKGDSFSGSVITDVLYGAEDGSNLKESMNDIKQFADLRSWSSEAWTSLLQKYYIDTHPVIVLGKPSPALAESLEKVEKARIAQQVKDLGPEGLKKAEAELEDAKAKHDQPIPTEMLTSFPVPDVKSISWIPVQSVQEIGEGRTPKRQAPSAPDLKRHITSDGSPLPYFVQYDHVQSDFVSVQAVFSLAKIPNRLRPLVSVYLSSFFSLGVKRQSGEHLTHEEVVNKLEDETVSYDVGLGMSNAFTDTFRVSLKVETARYDTAVAWLKDLICGAQFEKDRLQIVIAKVLQGLPELKRSGDNILGSLWAELVYSDESTSRAGSVMTQLEYVPRLAKQLQESPLEVIADFEEIRTYLTDPTAARFSVTGNVLSLKKPRSTWAKHFGETHPATELSPVPFAADTLSEVGKNPVKKAIVMSLPTIESSYVSHATKAIQGFNHPDYAVLRVASEVLNATESYLWRYIRGSGLAYGAYVSLDVEAGLLSFTLYRSSNSIGAFQEAAKVVKGLVDRSIELDQTTIDAAKSSIVYGVTKNVSTAGRAALVSFANQALRGVSKTYQVDLLEKYQAVSKEDILAALEKHFLPLFVPASSVNVTVTAPSKADQIAEGLAEAGFEVERRVLEVDPDEAGEDEDSESGSESECDSDDPEHSCR